jgi:hypothetical protein
LKLIGWGGGRSIDAFQEGEMNRLTMNTLIVMLSFFVAGAANAHSVSLTGAVVYDGANDFYGWTSSTVPGYGYRLYITPNIPTGSFINASDSTINYALSQGQNVFYMFGFGDVPLSYPEETTFGLNLFLNDMTTNFQSTPEISGTTASNYGTQPLFTSNPLTATTAGSLTYMTNGDFITLTLFNFDIPNTPGVGTGYNRVSAFSPTPYVGGGGDAVGEFILDVSTNPPAPTPLPSAWIMLITGFVGLGFFAHRGAKKSSVPMAAA